MAANADSVVVELIAKTEQLDRPVQQSASNFSQNMDRITASATKAETAVTKSASSQAAAIQREAGQVSQVMTRLATDMVGAGDLISLPFTVPVKHAPAAGAAITGLASTATALGGVLETVSGVGVALLVASFVEMIAKSNDSSNAISDLVEKLKEHARETELDRQAQEAFGHTLDGQIEKYRKLTDEIIKQITTRRTELGVQLAHASSDLQSDQKALSDAARELRDAQTALTAARSASGPAVGIGGAGVSSSASPNVAAAAERVAAAQKRVDDLTKAIGFAQQGVRDLKGEMSGIDAKEASDPIARINALYDQQASAARLAALGNDQLTASLTKQLTAIENNRRAALKAEQEREAASRKTAASTGEFGRHIGFGEAEAIARDAGLTVTSGYRSTEKQAELYRTVRTPENPVARPGTSAHEGVNGKWALDIAFAPGLSAQSLKKLYGDQGVTLSAVYKEAGHYHIEGRTGAGGGRTPVDNTARDAQREVEREGRYQQEKDSLEGEVLDARRALARDSDAVAAFETLAVKASHDRTQDAINAAQAQAKLLPEEAAKLRAINDERERYRLQLVEQRRREAQFAAEEANYQRGREFQSASYSAEEELLRSQEGLARTATQRRQIEQRLIDLQFAEERLKDQYIIGWAERVKANKDATDKEKADAQLAENIAKLHQGTADQRHANATYGNEQTNASPLHAYFNSLPQTADDINAALENVAAHGLETFNNSLADAIVNFHSLGDVGRTVLQGLATDLIRLALQQIELHTIGAALGSTAAAATTAQAAVAGAAWAGPAAMASLATLGANAGPASAAIASTVALATVLGAPKAEGGRIYGPGTATSDSILTPTSAGEFVIRTSAAKALGYDVLEYANRHGELPGYAMGGAIRPTNGSISHGQPRGGITRDDIASLERAIRSSQSDISLYASLDPAEVLQRALGHPRGHKALMAHLGANATTVRATINRP